MELTGVSPARRWLALPFLVAALLLASCSPAPQPSPTSITQPTVPGGVILDPDGTVTVGVASLPRDFNPSTPAGDNRVTQMIMSQVWPQPFVLDPTFTYDTTGLLQSAEVQGISPFTVQYVINPHAEWSDGVPITATDFIYNWHQHLQHSARLPDAGLVAGYRDIRSIVGSAGGKTVTVRFRRAFSEWQALFANLVPAHIGRSAGWSAPFQQFSSGQIVSGGPFEITSVVSGQSVTLSRNPHWWGTPAHVAHIRFLVEPGASELVAGLESGSVSVGEVPASVTVPGVASPGGASGSGSGSGSSLAWMGELGNQLWQLVFNTGSGLTAQLALRRGIEHALDRSEIVADSEGLVDPRVPAATSRFLMAGAEAAVGAGSGTAPKVPTLYEPRVAASFFGEDGYFVGAGGWLRADEVAPPLHMTLLVPSQDVVMDRAAEVMQAELRDAGLQVTIESRPLSQMLETLLPQGKFEMALAPSLLLPTVATEAPQYSDPVKAPGPGGGGASSAGAGAGDSGSTGDASSSAPHNWTTLARPETDAGASAAGAMTRNDTGFEDGAVDSRLVKSLQALSSATSLADLDKAEGRLWNQVVTIPLFQPGYNLVRSVHVDNITTSPAWSGIMWDAEDWVIVTAVKPGAK